MMNLLELFALKMVDTIINSGKTIFMIRNKKFLSALSQAISNIFYIILMSKLMKSTDMASILTTSAAMFIGQYLSQWLAEKFDKEKVWKICITPATKEDAIEMSKKLVESNIAVQTFSCYNREQKGIGLNVFSESRAQSAIVDNLISEYSGVKYNITIIRNRF